MSPLVLVLVAIGIFGALCGGFTVAAEVAAHLAAARRRDPLAPDRDRDDLRKALARTNHI